MNEPTLSTTYRDLKAEVGHFLGYGRGSEYYGDVAWSDAQLANITRCIEGGLRRVYHHDHSWSFMRATAQLTLESGSDKMWLPDDWGGKEGKLFVVAGDESSYAELRLTGVGAVLARRSQFPDRTGKPQAACEETESEAHATHGQRRFIRVWPTADQAYTCRITYYVNASMPTSARPYVYGGSQHTNLYLCAVRAEAELILDGAPGEMEKAYQTALVQAIKVDARNKAEFVGKMQDASDGEMVDQYLQRRLESPATVTWEGN